MRTLILATLLALPMSPALADGSATGTRGGTVEWTRDCARGDGQASCTIDSTATGPGGNVWTKSRVRTTERGSSTTDVTLTGPGGETRTRKRIVTWGN
jgi:hypothetical protein